MAISASHGGLPYPIRGARYSVLIEHRASTTGIPTDPATPDTEVSRDGGAFADAVEEAAVLTGSNGMSLLTLTGAETDCSLLAVASKAATGATTSLLRLAPRVLPVVLSGTALASTVGNAPHELVLEVGTPPHDFSGCIVKTTGGTGGGGVGGANNQARLITAYNPDTRAATIAPDWETNPSNDTTYEVLMTELCVNAMMGPYLMPADMGAQTLDVTALLAALEGNTLTAGMLQRAR